MANKTLKSQRKAWLGTRKIRNVADATGLEYGTAYKIINSNRIPRKKYLEAIIAVYPDFPHGK